MMLQIMCVRDSAINAYGTPYFTVAVGGALRGFTTEVNRGEKGNALFDHADDFELYHLGSYDDQDAVFKLFDAPVMVVRAKDLKK